MKNGSIFWFLAVVLILSGCMIDSSDYVESSTQETGSLEVTVAPVAPWVVTDKQDASSSSSQVISKAILGIGKIDFELKTSANVLVDSWTTIVSDFMSTTDTRTVPAGNDYVLYAYVYNTVVSTTSPTVSGSASNIDVSPGATVSVTVTCLPISPTSTTEDYWTSTYSLSTGGEKWFIVSTPYMTTRFHIRSVSGDMDIYIFNPDGTYTTYFNASTATESYVDVPTPSNPYYIGMWGFSTGSGQVGWASIIDPTGTLNITIQ